MVMMRTLRAQAAEVLRGLIEDHYASGDRLPPEPELARQLGLSRNTVREAIAELVAEGRLEKKWGVGTTVRTPGRMASFSLNQLGSFRETIEAAGHVPSIAEFRTMRVQAPEMVDEVLEERPGGTVLFVERIVAADGRPVVMLQDWCLPEIDGRPVDLEPLRDLATDLPSLLREQTGVSLHRLEGRMDARMTPPQLHGAEPPRPVLEISQSCWTSDDRAVVFTIVLFDTSVLDLTINRVFPR